MLGAVKLCGRTSRALRQLAVKMTGASRRERKVKEENGTTGWQVRYLDAFSVGFRDCL
jgi:hypothetical protein